MPPRKKNIITTESWPALREGRLYEARVKSAVPDKATGFLQVAIENLAPDQLGRIHKLKLPLPVRPGNRACAFLAACGIDAMAVGTTVNLDSIANVVVGMRLRGLGANNAEEFDFEPVARRPEAKNTEIGVSGIKDTAVHRDTEQ